MRKFFIAAAVAVISLIGSASTAEATFSVRITTLSGSQTITDGATGDLDGGPNNSLTVNYSDASYILVGTISFTNAPGTSTLGLLDVSYNISTRNLMGGTDSTGGMATMEVSATGFTQPADNPITLTSTVNGNGSGTGTISFQQYANTSNTLFGTGPNTPGLEGPFNVAGSYSTTLSTQFSQVGPYALTDVLTFNLSPGANTSGDSQTTVSSPAPAGLVLALSAVPALGIGGWLRRRRTSIS